MERALVLGKDAVPTVKAQALHFAGFLALMQDDNIRAEAFLRESQISISRKWRQSRNGEYPAIAGQSCHDEK